MNRLDHVTALEITEELGVEVGRLERRQFFALEPRQGIQTSTSSQVTVLWLALGSVS